MAQVTVNGRTVEVRARSKGNRWQADYKFGGYWFPLKSRERLRSFASAEAARKAAGKEGSRYNRIGR
jgi:hypothetical protein